MTTTPAPAADALAQQVDEVFAKLTLADRCDRCGAAAQAQVLTASGTVLLFCGHHYRRHLPALEGAGYVRATTPDGEPFA